MPRPLPLMEESSMKAVLLALAAVILTNVPAWAQYARVAAARASVREQPDSKSPIAATVMRDAALEVIATVGEWLHVRVTESGIKGYIPVVFVGAITDAPADPRPDAASTAPPDAPSAASPDAPPENAAAAPGAGTARSQATTSTRTFLGRVFGGLWNRGGTHGQVGGGIAVTPFSNPALEISADGSYYRYYGVNAYGGSVNATFNVVVPSWKFTPFFGGGLAVVHQPGYTVELDPFGVFGRYEVGGATDTVLQILGGVDLPFSDRRALRGELRYQFLPGGTSVAALAGISF
jgi:hypothetical protein